MPRRIESRCAYNGCQEPRYPSKRYCERHTIAYAYAANRRKEERKKRVEFEDVHAKERAVFYRSTRWRNLRKLQLAEEPLCRKCGEPARVVDHVEPIRHGGDRYDQTNLQSLCDSCHNSKRAEEARTSQYAIPVTLVLGPPYGGKTTFVREQAQAKDVVVDLDALMFAITRQEGNEYEVERCLLPFACEARDAIIRRFRLPSDARMGWIISTSITDDEIDAHKALGGRVALLVPRRSEVYERARRDVRTTTAGEPVKDWARLIDRWYRERAMSRHEPIRRAVERWQEHPVTGPEVATEM